MLTGLLRSTKLYPSILCALFVYLGYGIPTPVQAQIKSPSRFEARLLNMEAPANEPFRYNATLFHGDTPPVVYEFQSDIPAGWQVRMRVDGNTVTSVQMEQEQSREIGIEINAPFSAKPGKYPLSIKALSPRDTLSLALEAVVRGTYGMELTTPTGRLSDEVTTGSRKQVKILIKNTGTLPLQDIELSAQLPSKWESTFEPAQITHLEAGKSTEVQVVLNVPEKTIAGDYAAKLLSKNVNTQAETAFRFTVKTSLLSGWIGVIVIACAIGLIVLLIRKYGRR
ncbi:COG1470 family protein [Sphingobacterium suaedae]|uniref:NEW3 domain-containing protein n=1 Tax=Sphingobacterium suaedae TaxID=1686402 RepID=A0ABW5KEW9_9SPHI